MSLLAILLASLLGSPHCAGMCGGFALFCSGGARRAVSASIFYNVGRLCTYVGLGAAAGAAGAGGESLLSGTSAAGMLPYALGAALIVLGAAQLFGWRPISAVPAPKLVAIARRGVVRAAQCPAPLRGAIVGSISTLLPCGWLYSFLLVAAGSGSARDGAVTMAVFWIGTVPMMAAIGEISRRFLSRWGAQVPAITAALLIAAGLLSIGAHAGMMPAASGHHQCGSHMSADEP